MTFRIKFDSRELARRPLRQEPSESPRRAPGGLGGLQGIPLRMRFKSDVSVLLSFDIREKNILVAFAVDFSVFSLDKLFTTG